MQMHVKDRLTRVGIRVDDGTVATVSESFCFGNLRCEEMQPADHLRIFRLIERRHMLARNHEDMNRSLRIDIPKPDTVLILRDDCRRDLFPDDAAEQAIVGHSPSPQ